MKNKKVKRIHKIILDIPKAEIIVFYNSGKISLYEMTPSKVKFIKGLSGVMFCEYSNRYTIK